MGPVRTGPRRLHKRYRVVHLKATGKVFLLRSLGEGDCVCVCGGGGLGRNHVVGFLYKEMIGAAV